MQSSVARSNPASFMGASLLSSSITLARAASSSRFDAPINERLYFGLHRVADVRVVLAVSLLGVARGEAHRRAEGDVDVHRKGKVREVCGGKAERERQGDGEAIE